MMAKIKFTTFSSDRLHVSWSTYYRNVASGSQKAALTTNLPFERHIRISKNNMYSPVIAICQHAIHGKSNILV